MTLTAGHILNLGTLELTGFEPAITTGMSDFSSPIGTPHPDGTSTLNASELGNVGKTSSLRVTNKSLTSLAGVGHYTRITTLWCDQNQLTTLNASGLAELQTLVCNDNQLTTLNVSGLTKLETLRCYNNKLTTLDLNGLTELTNLNCYANVLSALDITQQTKLTEWYCGGQKGGKTLTLTLTSAQKSTWETDTSMSGNYKNERVTLNVKD